MQCEWKARVDSAPNRSQIPGIIMKERIVATYPGLSLLLLLLICLFGDYLCLDLKFFHYLQFSAGVTGRSPWFWVIFGLLLFFTLYSARQILFPTKLLVADRAGLEMNYRPFRAKVRIAWKNVTDIRPGQIPFKAGQGGGTMEAITFVMNSPANLGGVTSNMVRAGDGSVSFAACLFEDGLEETMDQLRAWRAAAGHR